jgi:capsular exopolysaccharide synthesis family protein
LDIVAYLRMLRRHWKIIVAAMMIGALLGWASSLANGDAAPQRTYYKATHTLFLDTSDLGDVVRPVYTNLDQIAVLVTTGAVPERVADKLGGEPREWASHIFTVTNGTTNTLDITCAAKDAEVAVTCADTFAEELIASLKEREEARFNTQRDETIQRVDQLQAQLNQLDAQIAARPPNADLLAAQRQSLFNQYRLAWERLQQLADQGGPVSIVSTLEAAEAQPISKGEYDNRIARGRLGENRVRADFSQSGESTLVSSGSGDNRFSGPVARGLLGGLLGLMIGVGLAVVADRVDRRLRTREEVEAAFGMPVLAEVPALTSSQQKETQILSSAAPLSATAEAYRAVRSSLMFQRAADGLASGTDGALVVLVTSAGPKEGKTTTSANLAVVFAETGSRVLVINCDFRRPTLHQYFDLPNEPRRVFETQTPGLWVITDVVTGSVAANPAVVVEEQRRLVASARKRFDIVILDTAPLLTTNDATEIMDSIDLVAITCRSGVTNSEGAQRARELLTRIAAPVAGVVLLGSEASPNDYYYYYSRSRAKQLASAEPAPPGAASTHDGLFGPDPGAEHLIHTPSPEQRPAT